MNSLKWKTITVIGSQPSLNDSVSLISLTINPGDSENIHAQWVETQNLTAENAGDIIISPDSLLGGHVYWLDGITRHVRERVGKEIPVIVLYLTHAQDISSAPGIQKALGVKGIRNLLTGLAQLLESKE